MAWATSLLPFVMRRVAHLWPSAAPLVAVADSVIVVEFPAEMVADDVPEKVTPSLRLSTTDQPNLAAVVPRLVRVSFADRVPPAPLLQLPRDLLTGERAAAASTAALTSTSPA